MLDIAFVRSNPDIVKENIKNKFQDEKLPLVDEVIALDAERKEAIGEVDALKANRNKISKANGMLYGKLRGASSDEEKAELEKEIAKNNEAVTKDSERMAELDDELMQAYFDDNVTYKWFYDGRLQTTTKNNSYEIKNSMLGHYIAVKVVYGDKSIASEEFEITKASTTGKLGDVDNDGEITIMDATAIQRHIAKSKILTDDEISRADTDRDGEISIMDTTAIQRYIAKLITEF
jgi:transcription antitermination factor NusG